MRHRSACPHDESSHAVKSHDVNAPSPSVVAALAMVMLGFGVALGNAAGPRTQDSLAASVRPPITVMLPHAATPPSTPEPPPSEPAVTPPGADGGSRGNTSPAALAPEAPPTNRAGTPKHARTHQPVTPAADAPTAPPIKHVWLVALGHVGYGELYGPESGAPYLAKSLAPQGALLSAYHPVTSGSLANTIALLSGQGPNPQTQANCPIYGAVVPGTTSGRNDQIQGEGCVYGPHALALPDQLIAAGLTWKSYVEGQGPAATCRHPDAAMPDPWQAPHPDDPYVTWRNPLVYFQSIAGSPDCATHDVGLDALDADLSSADATPSFSYIAPGPCHDGRPTPCQDGAAAGPAAADGFLQTLVPKIQASAAYADGGLVVITSDEDAQGADGPVGALLLSEEVTPGTLVDTPYDHYSLLKSIEDVFGLRYLGLAQRDVVKAFDAGIWRPSP